MSRRIILTDRECEYLIDGLIALQGVTTLDYQVIKVGKQVYQDIIDKLSVDKELEAKQ
jgi:hypothetical protein